MVNRTQQKNFSLRRTYILQTSCKAKTWTKPVSSETEEMRHTRNLLHQKTPSTRSKQRLSYCDIVWKKWVLLVSVVYLKLQFQSAYPVWVVHNWFRIRRQETSEKNPCIQLCIRFKVERTGMKDLILLFVIILLIYSYWTEKLACI